MSNVTISRELLQALIDFADNCTSAKDWPTQNRQISEARAILAAPAPAPVTYTVKWQAMLGRNVYASGVTHAEALDMVMSFNANHEGMGFINHWAEGTDGSIIGYVGAPK